MKLKKEPNIEEKKIFLSTNTTFSDGRIQHFKAESK